jgi:fructose-1-phosphate kinase PfkB-like protein
MARPRVLQILKKIPTGTIKVGDREVFTSIAVETEKYKRLDVVVESQKALLHNTLKENPDMIDPRTHEVVLTQVISITSQ